MSPMLKLPNIVKQFFSDLQQVVLMEEHTNKAIKDDHLLNYFGSLAKYHPDLLLLFSPKGKILSQNKTNLYHLIGYKTIEEINIKKIIPRDSYRLLREAFRKALNREHIQHDVAIWNKQQEIINLSISFIPVLKDKHDLVGVCIIVRNLTTYKNVYAERKKLEHALENTSDSYQSMIDHLHIGIWKTELSTGKVMYVSKGMEEIFSIPRETMYQNFHIWEKMIHPDDEEIVQSRLKELYKGNIFQHRYRIISGDGTLKWVTDEAIPYYNKKGELTHLFGMIKDITPDIETQEQLTYLANYDALTNLPNHRNLRNKLIHLCEYSNHFAVLCIHIDDFQQLNHALGYKLGDKLLIYTAKQLKKILPEKEYIARMSGDTFLVTLQNHSSKEAVHTFAEDIINLFEHPITINEYNFHINISIGISFFPEDGDNKVVLLERAYAALYHAKNHMSSRYQIYSFSKDISAYKKFMLEQDLRRAIQHNKFELYYQPQIDANDGIIKGAEALIRWNHEEWGLVSPGEFISIAEKNHLIFDLTNWVIGEVCQQLQTWKTEGYTLRPISINISPICFLQDEFVDSVKQQLATTQISPKYIVFEITENKALTEREITKNILTRLRNIGIKIAIDDYGTGYTSVQYLHDFDVDMIKIDQMFIQSIDDVNDKDASIVASLIHLAKGLGITVVGEGVETYEQLQFLKQKECDWIQGYLFSKPVPLKKFKKMMKTGYLYPKKKAKYVPKEERRRYYRLILPNFLPAQLAVSEINNRKVNLGTAPILIENISIGGIKIMSTLKLPIHSNMKFKFCFTVMEMEFTLPGNIIWKNEAIGDIFYYGIEFDTKENERDSLARIINQLTVLQKQNKEIPNTEFVHETAHLYFKTV